MASSRKLVWTHPCENLARELLIPVPPSVLVGVITADTFYDSLFAQPFALALEAEISEARKVAIVVHKQREGRSARAQTRCSPPLHWRSCWPAVRRTAGVRGPRPAPPRVTMTSRIVASAIGRSCSVRITTLILYISIACRIGRGICECKPARCEWTVWLLTCVRMCIAMCDIWQPPRSTSIVAESTANPTQTKRLARMKSTFVW